GTGRCSGAWPRCGAVQDLSERADSSGRGALESPAANVSCGYVSNGRPFLSLDAPGTAVTAEKEHHAKSDADSRVWREVVSWFWVILAFLFIEGTLVQARVIPSGSMKKTVLIGDHLIVSRFGYDAGVPFTQYHVPLWRNPKRQQI